MTGPNRSAVRPTPPPYRHESAGQIAGLVGETVRILAPAYAAVRRTCGTTVVGEVRSDFQALVGEAMVTHDFTVVITGIPYSRVHCTVGITCDNLNVAEIDYTNLITALTAYFDHSLGCKLEKGKLEFALPVEAIL